MTANCLHDLYVRTILISKRKKWHITWVFSVLVLLAHIYRVFAGNSLKVQVYCSVHVAFPELRQVVKLRLYINILIFGFWSNQTNIFRQNGGMLKKCHIFKYTWKYKGNFFICRTDLMFALISRHFIVESSYFTVWKNRTKGKDIFFWKN